MSVTYSHWLNNPQLSDIIFRVREQDFYAHKFLLCIRCPHFKTLLGKLNQPGQIVVSIPDLDPLTFLEILRLIYCDEINYSSPVVLKLIEVAQMWKLIQPTTEDSPQSSTISSTTTITSSSSSSSPPSPQDLESRGLMLTATISECVALHVGSSFLADLKLYADVRAFPAHKIILCSQSSYFRDALLKDNDILEVRIEQVTFNTLSAATHYMYTGFAIFTADSCDLLEVALLFKLDPLIRQIEEYLFGNGSHEEIDRFLKIAPKLGYHKGAENYQSWKDRNVLRQNPMPTGGPVPTSEKPMRGEEEGVGGLLQEEEWRLGEWRDFVGESEFPFVDKLSLSANGMDPVNWDLEGFNKPTLPPSGDIGGNADAFQMATPTPFLMDLVSEKSDQNCSTAQCHMVSSRQMPYLLDYDEEGYEDEEDGDVGEHISQKWEEAENVREAQGSCGSGNPDILQVLQCVMDSIVVSHQCERGFVFIIDPLTNKMCCYVCSGISTSMKMFPIEAIVEGRVLRTGHPLFVDVSELHGNKSSSRQLLSDGVSESLGMTTTSILAVPFVFGQSRRVVGVASVRNTPKRNKKYVDGLLRAFLMLEKVYTKFLMSIEMMSKELPPQSSGLFSSAEVTPVCMNGTYKSSLLVSIDHSCELEGGLITRKPSPESISTQVQNSLGSSFESYFNNSYLSDVVFCVGEIQFYAHRVFLSFRNPFFERLFRIFKFYSYMTVYLRMEHVDPQTVWILLRFLYCDSVCFSSDDDLWAVCHIARFYGVYKLQRLAEDQIASFLTLDTICSIHSRAQQIDSSYLIERCTNFYQKNFHQLTWTEGFQNHGAHMVFALAKIRVTDDPLVVSLDKIQASLIRKGLLYSTSFNSLKPFLESFDPFDRIPEEIVPKIISTLEQKNKLLDSEAPSLLPFERLRLSLDIIGFLFKARVSYFYYSRKAKKLCSRIDPDFAIHVEPMLGIVGACYQTKKVIYSPNVREDERFYCQVDQETNFETHDIVALPICFNENVVGVLEIVNLGEEFYEGEDGGRREADSSSSSSSSSSLSSLLSRIPPSTTPTPPPLTTSPMTTTPPIRNTMMVGQQQHHHQHERIGMIPNDSMMGGNIPSSRSPPLSPSSLPSPSSLDREYQIPLKVPLTEREIELAVQLSHWVESELANSIQEVMSSRPVENERKRQKRSPPSSSSSSSSSCSSSPSSVVPQSVHPKRKRKPYSVFHFRIGNEPENEAQSG